MAWEDLPTLNAALNATAAFLLVLGYAAVRRKRIGTHRNCMVAAVSVSAAFLVSYLAHKIAVGHVVFQAKGPVRTLYLAILLSHTVLAVVIVPMVLRTLFLGLKGRIDRHRRLARWTLPLWLYVSVTGVVVYWMLYRGPGRG